MGKRIEVSRVIHSHELFYVVRVTRTKRDGTESTRSTWLRPDEAAQLSAALTAELQARENQR